MIPHPQYIANLCLHLSVILSGLSSACDDTSSELQRVAALEPQDAPSRRTPLEEEEPCPVFRIHTTCTYTFSRVLITAFSLVLPGW